MTAPAADHGPPPSADVLREAASRFALGGCCGKEPKVRLDDLVALGLTPIPETFESSLGTIMPMFGWKEMCVWVHESLAGPFPIGRRAPDGSVPDPGEIVAEALVLLAAGAPG